MSEELSTRFDPKTVEDKWYQYSLDQRHFEPHGDGESFCIVIPPPNVTGILHMGHAFNNTLQDILTRRARMQGKRTLWLPGTDHAGIATQNKVEEALRKEGLDRKEMGREKFLERVWDWKEHHGGVIINQLKKLGASCDWTRERFTLDPGLSHAVRTVFKKLYDEGLIYRAHYLVNWCPQLQTALSDDEVEYKEVNGKLWHFKYPIKDSDECVQVATTRPETMLGDTAVAVNPDDERYKHLIGKTVVLPLMNREIPIIADSYVDPAFGTGMVKVTPAHDPNDFEMGRRHNLEFINILTTDGHLNDNVGDYKGLDRWSCRKKVVADLDALGWLVKIEDHLNQVGHCYRTGDVVEPYMSRQWFVKMRPLAEPALAAVRNGDIRITPKNWENTYFHWLENVRDWCISRQLWWGHRIPVWYCEDCDAENVPADGEPTTCEKCGSTHLRQDPDVLDTWFSSALWPFSTLGWPEETQDMKDFYPTSVLSTAHEILFFWVARMIMMGLKFQNAVPFRDVYIHSMIFDEKTRKKMSKSLGNIIDPLEMIDQYGADAVRFTCAAIVVNNPVMYLSEKRFEGYRNFTNKVYNASRFVLMNTNDLTPDQLAAGLDVAALETEDRWILSELQRTIDRVNEAYDALAFDQIAHHIYQFLWSYYCDWYLELVKPRLYGDQEDEVARASRTNAQRTLVVVLDHILRLSQPLMPFISEELWQHLRGRYGAVSAKADGVGDRPTAATLRALGFDSVVIAPWMDQGDCDWIAAAQEQDAASVQEVIECLRTVRGELDIPPKESAAVYLNGPVEPLRRLEAHGRWFQALVPISALVFGENAPEGAFCSTGVVDEVSVSVVVPASLLEAERKRVEKEIQRLEGETVRLSSKLGNESFIGRAPEAVVQKERDKLTRAETELAQLRAKMARL